MSAPAARSRSRSPERTPRTSPVRLPLVERTESQTNSRPNSTSYDDVDAAVYSKSPFPNLPSQVLAPKGRKYFLETENNAQLDTPSRPSREEIRAGKARDGASYSRRIRQNVTAGDIETLPQLAPAARRFNPDDTVAPLLPRKSIEREKRRIKEAAIVSNRRAVIHDRTDTPGSDRVPTPSFQRETRLSDFPPPGTGTSTASTNPTYRPVSSTTYVEFTGTPPARPRSRSSADERPVGSAQSESPSLVSATPDSLGHRRSVSSPSSPKNASHQAVLAHTAKVQYVSIRPPSTSFRAESSSPAPAPGPGNQRIVRKRANSNLQKTASAAAEVASPPEPAAVASGSQQVQDIANEPQMDALETMRDSTIPPIPAEAKAWITNQRMSSTSHRVSGFSEELGDTVPELQAQPLRPQRSVLTNKSPDSRPNTNSSVQSAGSFYNFLNSSIATWAKAYYRHGEPLRMPETPSHRSIAPPRTASSTRLGSAASGSGPSHSPSSADFPSQIYIPRIRPFQSEQQPELYSSDENIRVIQTSSADSGSNTAVGESSRTGAQREHTASRTVRYSPPQHRSKPPGSGYFSHSPRLGLDTRVSSMISAWRAPSYDEDLGTFSRGNRQIWLFCGGFVMPLAWLLAAILPLPPRPQWRRDVPGSIYLSREEKDAFVGATGDLFDPLDVRRFQKANWWRNANRFMSAVGLVVIAVIIACAIIATKS